MRSTAVKELPERRTINSPEALDEALSRLFALKGIQAAELILVRHAEPDYRAGGNGRDPLDPPLTERGRWQAMRLAMRLRPLAIDAIYTSTMRRALETAVFIAAAKDLPMFRMHQIREVNFDADVLGGIAVERGKLTAELAIRFLKSGTWDALPGFEPSYQFRQRVTQAFDGILAHHPGQRVIVVTHGGVINAHLSMMLDIASDFFFLPEHASISVVRSWRDMWALQRLNDVAHLLPTFSPR